MKDFMKLIKPEVQSHIMGVFIIFLFNVLYNIIVLIQPFYIQNIVDKVIPSKQVNELIKIGILYIVLLVISAIVKYLTESLKIKLKKICTYSIKGKLIEKINCLSGNEYSGKKTGEFLKIIEDDLYTIENTCIEIFDVLIINCITAVFALIILIKLNAFLLCIVVVLEILMILFQKYYIKMISFQTREVRSMMGKSLGMLEELISGLMSAVLTKSNKFASKRYMQNEKKVIEKSQRLERQMEANQLLANQINEIMILLTYVIGGVLVIREYMTLGTIIIFNQYVFLLVSPIMQVINMNAKIQMSNVAARNILNIFELEEVNNEGRKKFGIGQSLIFSNVTFGYNSIDKALNGISMNFEKGKKIAIVGESGGGKSTIIRLLYRLWEPQSGEIFLDGFKIEDYKLEELRENIAIVTQDTILFDDTIVNNILLDEKKDTIKIKEIMDLLQINTLIKLKKNEKIGEQGQNLSGGQKQRLMLARALLQDCPIVILDEATASLDNISQGKIMSNIDSLLKNKMVIIIAHRLSTIKDLDYIYVLKDGKVFEEGRHSDLLKNGKLYSEMLEQEKV